MNNPINMIDPDGRAPEHIEPVLTKGGGKEGRDLLTLKVTGKIINFSDNDVDMKSALANIKSVMESSFQGENVDGVDMNLEFNFSVAENMNDVSESDHLIVLGEGKEYSTPGVSNGFGGKVAAVDADYFTGLYDRFIGGEGERTASHEMGHLFGLKHKSNVFNLMSQGHSVLRGNSINNKQLGSIKSMLNRGALNLGSNSDNLGRPNLGVGWQKMDLRKLNGRVKTSK